MRRPDLEADVHDPSVTEELSEARATAAEALRRFGHALHSREADLGLLQRVAERADATTELLVGAPRRERDLDRLRRQMWTAPIADGGPIDHFDDCFVSGSWNPMGIGVSVTRDGDEVSAEVTLGPAYEGAPGRSHGGIVAAIFDDVLGCLLPIIGKPAFTGELTVRYLAPTPIMVPLRFRAWVVAIDGRKIDTASEAVTTSEDGQEVVVATATARFIEIQSYV